MKLSNCSVVLLFFLVAGPVTASAQNAIGALPGGSAVRGGHPPTTTASWSIEFAVGAVQQTHPRFRAERIRQMLIAFAATRPTQLPNLVSALSNVVPAHAGSIASQAAALAPAQAAEIVQVALRVAPSSAFQIGQGVVATTVPGTIRGQHPTLAPQAVGEPQPGADENRRHGSF
jgi:hypothetical protein